MNRVVRHLPASVSVVILVVLGFYLLPHLTYFSYRPVLLLSRDAAQSVLSATGATRDRSSKWLIQKNVQGVVFFEETLQDLQKAGRAFVASGEELLRLFKLQSVASYYVFEQIRDKNLNPAGSYVFISEAPLFNRVFEILRWRLAPGDVVIFERGIFKGDASFPDNFILESSVSAEKIRTLPLGWPVEKIEETLSALQSRRGDTLWPVLWSESSAPFASVTMPDTELPGAVHLQLPLLRVPYDSVRIVHDPVELISLPRSSNLGSLLALPTLPPNLPLGLAILVILVASLRLTRWIRWSILITAGFLVLLFALLPSQKNWVLEGVTALLFPSALICWMASADEFRSARGRGALQGINLLKFSLISIVFLAPAGWLLATLFWQFPSLPLPACAVAGILAVPAISAALFLAVWGIEVSNRPIYPRHLRTGLELAGAMAILYGSTSGWVLSAAEAIAWARWLVLVERTHGRSLEDAPGNYAAFFVASALGLKLFFEVSPLFAVLIHLAAFACGHVLAASWLARAARTP